MIFMARQGMARQGMAWHGKARIMEGHCPFHFIVINDI